MKLHTMLHTVSRLREQHVRVILLVGTLVMLATGCASPAGFDG